MVSPLVWWAMGISLDHSHHLRHVAGNEAEQMLARVSTAVLNGDANRGGLAERRAHVRGRLTIYDYENQKHYIGVGKPT